MRTPMLGLALLSLLAGAGGACKSTDGRGGTEPGDAGAVCSPLGGQCPAGTTCDFVGFCGTGPPAWYCRSLTAPLLALGETCGEGTTCPAESSCLASAAEPASCVAFCRGDGDCSSGRVCSPRRVFTSCPGGRSEFMVGVCQPRQLDGGNPG